MTVQAQYPSNILLLNRNVQETKTEYCFQQQNNGFLEQSHLLFANGVGNGNGNPRKRGRELISTTPVSQFPLQQSHHQAHVVDFPVLQTHQNHGVSTGLRLSFGDQNQNQNQNQNQLQQQHQNHNHQVSNSSSSSVMLSLLSDDFATQIKRQTDEIDQFLQAQGEQLRRTIADKMQRHYRALLGAAEEAVSRKLREKEAEAEKAARRNAELEARAAQISAEAHVWQAKARAQEATAVALQAQLQKAIMSGGVGGGGGERDEDGLLCAVGADDAESAYADPDRVVPSGLSGCRACGDRVASVVLLPCRHLSVCTECEAVVQACPVCLCPRSHSVQVLLS